MMLSLLLIVSVEWKLWNLGSINQRESKLIWYRLAELISEHKSHVSTRYTTVKMLFMAHYLGILAKYTLFQ